MPAKKNLPQPPKPGTRRAAVQDARQSAKAAKLRELGSNAAPAFRRSIRQAGRQAARQTRRTWQPPQPPAASAPGAPQGGDAGGYYEFQEPAGQQMAGPYADMLMGGGMAALPDLFRQFGQQGGQADLYAGATGDTLGAYRGLMGGNQGIQEALQRQIQAIQSGADSGYDPLLDQQLGQEQGLLEEQMRRQLGPDWQNSSAGMEALGRFNQRATTMRQSSRFNQLQGLLNQQQQGMGNLAGQGVNLGALYGRQAGQLYDQGMGFGQQGQNNLNVNINRTGDMMRVYGLVPQTLADFGYNMTNQGQAAVGAQGPYQADRFMQFRGDMGSPTQQQMMGMMMGQSGDRWNEFGQNMTNMGMGMR